MEVTARSSQQLQELYPGEVGQAAPEQPNAAGSGWDAVLRGPSRSPSQGWGGLLQVPTLEATSLQVPPPHGTVLLSSATKEAAGTRGWSLTLCSQDCVPTSSKGGRCSIGSSPGKAAADADRAQRQVCSPLRGWFQRDAAPLRPKAAHPVPKGCAGPTPGGTGDAAQPHAKGPQPAPSSALGRVSSRLVP